MIDDNWDLINGPDAHQIEVLNYSNQINVISALVRFVIHHQGGLGDGCPGTPNLEALCELHRSGTLFLLEKPGQFRTSHVHLQRADGTIVYDPPHHEAIPGHADEFIAELRKMWQNATPIEAAAFCLWKINWIHPFKNGNGRCARAFMYACLLLKYGAYELAGSPTVIDLISDTKPRFEAALAVADKVFRDEGRVDCSALETYIEELLVQQLSSIESVEEEIESDALT